MKGNHFNYYDMENVIISALAELLKPTIRDTVRETMLEIQANQEKPSRAVNEYMLLDEYAELRGITKESARVQKSRGEIPEHLWFKRGRRTYFRRAETMAWLESKSNEK